MKYNNGDKYQGNWKDTLRDRKNFVIKNNGDILKGYWKYDNLKEVKIKCQNGDVYNRELFDLQRKKFWNYEI